MQDYFIASFSQRSLLLRKANRSACVIRIHQEAAAAALVRCA